MTFLNDNVLVLNKNWIAIRIRTVKEVIKLLCRIERASIVDINDYSVYSWKKWVNVKVTINDKFIKTSRKKIKVPEVIILNKYDKFTISGLNLTKKNLLIRDNYSCQYTGKKLNEKTADIDHVIPKSRGGKSDWTNLVVSDKKINREKANKTPEEAGFKLLNKPVKPKGRILLIDPKITILNSWKKFI